MHELAPVMGMWGFMCAVGWIVWVVTNNRRRLAVAKTQAEMQAKLLDKLTASADLAEFLKSDAGRRLLETAGAEEPPSPYGRILGSIQAGVVLTLLGVALFAVSGQRMDAEAQQGLSVIGTMSGAVGLGFLITSAISYTLSKSWGLFERRHTDVR